MTIPSKFRNRVSALYMAISSASENGLRKALSPCPRGHKRRPFRMPLTLRDGVTDGARTAGRGGFQPDQWRGPRTTSKGTNARQQRGR